MPGRAYLPLRLRALHCEAGLEPRGPDPLAPGPDPLPDLRARTPQKGVHIASCIPTMCRFSCTSMRFDALWRDQGSVQSRSGYSSGTRSEDGRRSGGGATDNQGGGTRRVRLVREGGTRRVQLVREGGGGGGLCSERRSGTSVMLPSDSSLSRRALSCRVANLLPRGGAQHLAPRRVRLVREGGTRRVHLVREGGGAQHLAQGHEGRRHDRRHLRPVPHHLVAPNPRAAVTTPLRRRYAAVTPPVRRCNGHSSRGPQRSSPTVLQLLLMRPLARRGGKTDCAARVD